MTVNAPARFLTVTPRCAAERILRNSSIIITFAAGKFGMVFR